MSDIIMAGISSGLSVEIFEEFPHHISNSFWNVEASDIGLPMCYVLVLRETRASSAGSGTRFADKAFQS
jgi:hypothetical protein